MFMACPRAQCNAALPAPVKDGTSFEQYFGGSGIHPMEAPSSRIRLLSPLQDDPRYP